VVAVAYPRVVVPGPAPSAGRSGRAVPVMRTYDPPTAPSPRRSASPSATLRPAPAVFRRRRVGVAAFLGLAVYGTAHLGAALPGSGPLTAPGGAGAARPASEQVYVVRPGDTVWSIAHRFVPSGDERPLVDAITNEMNGAGLQPGQAISIP